MLNVGIRQGCVSSPIIFSLFINDLVKYIRQNCVNGVFISQGIDDLFSLMFADDVSSLADTVRNLQLQIHCIEQYCVETGICLNMDKSKVMVFMNGGPVKDFEKWTFNGDDIDIVPFYKYLGSFFTSNLSWGKTKDVLSIQATKAVLAIMRYQ